MKSFFTGLQFLTRISLVREDEWRVEDFGRSVKFFPLIGAVLGVIYAFFAYAIYFWLPHRGIVLPSHVASVIMLVLPLLMTGGLHCDGFMDTMDGIFSGRSRERMLEIMKDSRVGSNGVVGFGLWIVTAWAILQDLTPLALCEAMFAMPVIARLMMAAVIRLYPYARPEGMGKAFAEHSEGYALTFAVISAIILIAPLGVKAFIALAVCASFTKFFASFVTKKIGGVTGDIYGAVTMLSELLVLFSYIVSSAVL